MLELKDVSVSFAGLQALRNVSFSARSGEVRALIGPNGAGKTTLFNAITGYVPLSGGSIELNGAPIHGLSPHEIAALGVRRTFQNGGLFPELTALENVLAGLHRASTRALLGILFGTRAARAAERAAPRVAATCCGARGRHIRGPAGRIALGRPAAHGRDRARGGHRAAASAARRAGGRAGAAAAAATRRVIRRLAARDRHPCLIEHAVDLVMAPPTRDGLNGGIKVAERRPAGSAAICSCWRPILAMADALLVRGLRGRLRRARDPVRRRSRSGSGRGVALLGPNGSGKSTCLNAFPASHGPRRGSSGSPA